jgi:catechol 2,3-dioxygenase
MTLQSIDTTKLHPKTTLGHVTLSVANLERSVDFYESVIGMARIDVHDGVARLGAGNKTLLVLKEKPGAVPQPTFSTGLYHMAILQPERKNLADTIVHLAEMQYPLQGYADHLVSEAFYLNDPDGHGLELYWDRPQEAWEWENGSVKMASLPIDMDNFFAEATGQPWKGLADGTTIGHVHLRVGNVDQSVRFYCDILGFDKVAVWSGAGFISAGGYHHHIGMNTWQSRGAPQPPANAVKLEEFIIQIPDVEERKRIQKRLDTAGIAFHLEGDDLLTQDPWGIPLRFAF